MKSERMFEIIAEPTLQRTFGNIDDGGVYGGEDVGNDLH